MLYDEKANQWTLVGVVSFGNRYDLKFRSYNFIVRNFKGVHSLPFRCAEPGFPGVYTRLTHFMPWVLANLT